MDAIHDAQIGAEPAASVALPGGDPWTLLKAALGVDTQEEVAARAGISLRTLQRLIDRPDRSLGRNFLALHRSGVDLNDLMAATDCGKAA